MSFLIQASMNSKLSLSEYVDMQAAQKAARTRGLVERIPMPVLMGVFLQL